VPRAVLAKLVELRLLRADVRVGSVYYELSHDTLVEPIRAWRRGRERRRRIVWGAIAIAILAAMYGLPPLWEHHVRPFLAKRYLEQPGRELASHLPWVPVPPPARGSFMMGCVGDYDHKCYDDEKPRHSVALTRGFEMMRHEVAVREYRRLVNTASSFPGRILLPKTTMPRQPEGSQEDHPVANVSWSEATRFCEFVRGRLPTEAEWEYAARHKNPDAIYPWGNEYSPDQAHGSGDRHDPNQKTHPVDANCATDDLCNMAGNVSEWTSSLYRSYDDTSSDGEDPDSPEARAIRGGSWRGPPANLRVSVRDYSAPGNREEDVGFRCVRDASP